MFFFKKSKRPSSDIGGLVAGLGNPGPRYAETRHNMGFMTIEALLDKLERDRDTRPEELSQGKKFQSSLWRCRFPGVDAPWLLVMPQTFMNLSGDAVQPLMAWYKLTPDKLLVVHDELDLSPGRMMLKSGGGLAGHNGLKSIAQRLGDNGFHRLRLGIGRPADKDALTSWVTGRFSPADRDLVRDLIPQAADAVLSFARYGPIKAAGMINSKKKSLQVS